MPVTRQRPSFVEDVMCLDCSAIPAGPNVRLTDIYFRVATRAGVKIRRAKMSVADRITEFKQSPASISPLV